MAACLSYALVFGELGGEPFELLFCKFFIIFIFWPNFIIAYDLSVTEFSKDPCLDLGDLMNFELFLELYYSMICYIESQSALIIFYLLM